MIAEDAVSIAKRVTLECGWPWYGKISVWRTKKWFLFGDKYWHVCTNSDCMGGNVRVIINDRTGSVYSKGFASY